MAKCNNCNDTRIDPITGATCTCSMPETGLPDDMIELDEKPEDTVYRRPFNDFMVDYQPDEVIQ